MVSEEIRGMIPDFVRGLLPPEEAQVVANALSTIPVLAKELDAAKRYYTVLNQLPESDIPVDFLDRINRRIDHKPWIQNIIDLLFKPFFPKIPLEFAGLAACLVVVVVMLKPELALHQKTELPLVINTSTYLNDESPQPAVSQDKKKVQAPAPRLPTAKKVDRVPPPVAMELPEIKKAPVPASLLEKKTADNNHALNAASGAARTPAQEYQADASQLQEKEGLLALKEPEEKPVSFAAIDIGAIELSYVSTLHKGNKLRAAKSAQAPLSRLELSPEHDLLENSAVPSEKRKEAAPQEDAYSALPDQNASPISISEILDSILVKYDSLLTIKSIHGMVSYTLTLSPDHLSALSKDLQQSFSVTSHLLPFDPLIAKLVKVSFIVKE
jgi:hypothetical protein